VPLYIAMAKFPMTRMNTIPRGNTIVIKSRSMLAALLIAATTALSAGGCALFEDEDEVGEPFDINEDDDDEDEY
jgi:hypothetical protein